MLTPDFDVVIPGRGPVATRADLVKFKAAFEGMRNRVRDLVRQGKDEVEKTLTTDYGRAVGGLAIAQVDRGVEALI